MFANEEFIEASRDFVCIRIETFESKESEQMVRSLLNGRFANTAFCLFDPQGKRRLSRPGRGPSSITGRHSSDLEIVNEMKRIAARFEPAGLNEASVAQDFDTFRQALNVASADQRPLILISSQSKDLKVLIQSVLDRDELIGRFHLDFMDRKTDRKWTESIRGSGNGKGIFVLRADKFGQSGEVMQQLPEDSDREQIYSTLLKANKQYASSESRKNYRQHVTEGRRQGIFFENAIPYGEDRDGDGKIDKVRNLRGRGR